MKALIYANFFARSEKGQNLCSRKNVFQNSMMKEKDPKESFERKPLLI